MPLQACLRALRRRHLALSPARLARPLSLDSAAPRPPQPLPARPPPPLSSASSLSPTSRPAGRNPMSPRPHLVTRPPRPPPPAASSEPPPWTPPAAATQPPKSAKVVLAELEARIAELEAELFVPTVGWGRAKLLAEEKGYNMLDAEWPELLHTRPREEPRHAPAPAPTPVRVQPSVEVVEKPPSRSKVVIAPRAPPTVVAQQPAQRSAPREFGLAREKPSQAPAPVLAEKARSLPATPVPATSDTLAAVDSCATSRPTPPIREKRASPAAADSPRPTSSTALTTPRPSTERARRSSSPAKLSADVSARISQKEVTPRHSRVLKQTSTTQTVAPKVAPAPLPAPPRQAPRAIGPVASVKADSTPPLPVPPSPRDFGLAREGSSQAPAPVLAEKARSLPATRKAASTRSPSRRAAPDKASIRQSKTAPRPTSPPRTSPSADATSPTSAELAPRRALEPSRPVSTARTTAAIPQPAQPLSARRPSPRPLSVRRTAPESAPPADPSLPLLVAKASPEVHPWALPPAGPVETAVKRAPNADSRTDPAVPHPSSASPAPATSITLAAVDSFAASRTTPPVREKRASPAAADSTRPTSSTALATPRPSTERARRSSSPAKLSVDVSARISQKEITPRHSRVLKQRSSTQTVAPKVTPAPLPDPPGQAAQAIGPIAPVKADSTPPLPVPPSLPEPVDLVRSPARAVEAASNRLTKRPSFACRSPSASLLALAAREGFRLQPKPVAVASTLPKARAVPYELVPLPSPPLLASAPSKVLPPRAHRTVEANPAPPRVATLVASPAGPQQAKPAVLAPLAVSRSTAPVAGAALPKPSPPSPTLSWPAQPVLVAPRASKTLWHHQSDLVEPPAEPARTPVEIQVINRMFDCIGATRRHVEQRKLALSTKDLDLRTLLLTANDGIIVGRLQPGGHATLRKALSTICVFSDADLAWPALAAEEVLLTFRGLRTRLRSAMSVANAMLDRPRSASSRVTRALEVEKVQTAMPPKLPPAPRPRTASAPLPDLAAPPTLPTPAASQAVRRVNDFFRKMRSHLHGGRQGLPALTLRLEVLLQTLNDPTITARLLPNEHDALRKALSSICQYSDGDLPWPQERAGEVLAATRLFCARFGLAVPGVTAVRPAMTSARQLTAGRARTVPQQPEPVVEERQPPAAVLQTPQHVRSEPTLATVVDELLAYPPVVSYRPSSLLLGY